MFELLTYHDRSIGLFSLFSCMITLVSLGGNVVVLSEEKTGNAKPLVAGSYPAAAMRFLACPSSKSSGNIHCRNKDGGLNMRFQRGFSEAVIGIIGGIIISALLAGFAKDGLIPSYLVISFTMAGFLGSIALFFFSKTTGFIFTLGWIVGALVLKDLLGPINFFVYLLVPIAALVIGGVASFRGSNNQP